jgi:amino acid transporter
MALEDSKQLAGNSLGIGESIVMGTAGAAPAFSLSAGTAALVASVGTLAPSSLLYCGLVMFGITLAFIHLNKVIVNAGASYAWVSHVFGRTFGFFSGWALLVASVVFMVSGSIPAATATLHLFAPQLIGHLGWVTFIAGLWITLIALVTIKGIKAASYLQVLMTGVELLILISIIVAGIYQFRLTPAHAFSWSWFSGAQFTPSLFATGALTAVFFYWGWDVTLNLNEETKNAKHAPGWGAFWSIVIIIALFVSFLVAALFVLSDEEMQRSSTNILFAISNKLFPQPWGDIAVISVILSTVGTIETTILQFTRTMYAQGRDKSLNACYAKLHPSWNTPWLASMMVWFFGVLLLLLSSYFSTVNVLIKDSVEVISFQVAFYYSLTGLACAWYYRSKWNNVRELFGYILWPMVSSFFLIFIAGYSIPTFDRITSIVGIGGILIGIVPYLLNRK